MAVWLTDIARLHPELLAKRPEVAPPDRQLESWQRVRFFESLAHAFRQAAPLLLVVDDLQWSDAETLEWLHYFLRSASERAWLVVGTVHAEEEQDNPALGQLLADPEHDDRVTVLRARPARFGRRPRGSRARSPSIRWTRPPSRARFRKPKGHPLFIIERGRMDRNEPGPAAGRGSRASSLWSRPGWRCCRSRHGAPLRSPPRSAAISPSPSSPARANLEEDALVTALDELWRRQIVRAEDGERWDFTHDRIREVAYSGIGPARQRLIHRRIAQAMELLL